MVNEIALLLRESGALEFGDFVLASGASSSYYVDIKTALTRPALLGAIGRTIAENYDFDVVAGVALGGVPLAVAVSLASGRPYAVIRKSEKEHGKTGIIIGDVADMDLLLVEDVTTSGGSALYGIEALRAAGASVSTAVTVIDREEGAAPALKRAGVHFSALATVSELLNM